MNVPISKLKANPKNPRVIKRDKYEKLKKSLEAFPQMLEKRPLVVYTEPNGKYVVLGGNMRLKAAKELGIAELPVIIADDWTDEQKAEFLIKDNVNFGDWDHEQLANEWDEIKLQEWGIDLPVFEPLEAQDDAGTDEPEQSHVIKLEYTQNEYVQVKARLAKIASTPEQAVWQLLEL